MPYFPATRLCCKSNTRCDSCSVNTTTDGWEEEFMEIVAKGFMPGAADDDRVLRATLKKIAPGVCAPCSSCWAVCCYSCLDGQSAKNLAQEFLLYRNGEQSCNYRCGKCYWSAKPCTNPKCPNKADTPTKRCGGCHLDRYCSVECQAEMYPDHVAKCQKIQAKRVAKEEKRNEWSDWIGS